MDARHTQLHNTACLETWAYKNQDSSLQSMLRFRPLGLEPHIPWANLYKIEFPFHKDTSCQILLPFLIYFYYSLCKILDLKGLGPLDYGIFICASFSMPVKKMIHAIHICISITDISLKKINNFHCTPNIVAFLLLIPEKKFVKISLISPF